MRSSRAKVNQSFISLQNVKAIVLKGAVKFYVIDAFSDCISFKIFLTSKAT